MSNNLKYVLLIFVWYSQSVELFAQKLPVIGVPSFAFEDPVTSNLANQVSEFIVSLLKNSGRYTIVDMTSEEQRKIALDRAQTNYKAENWIEPFAEKNAEIIVGGEITAIKFVKSNHPTQTGYRAAVTLTIKLIRVETSEITASANFATTTSELRLTPETALYSSLQSLETELMNFFRSHVAPVFPVIKINGIHKQSVNRFTAEIPVILGYKTGQKFKLVWYEKLGGRVVPEIIGEARIVKHISEDFWLMEVTRGDKEFYLHKDKLDEIQCSE